MGREYTKGKHRFEHWYRDNTVYFITARWVTTLLNNHYHTLGYLGLGPNLGPMMQRIHGSVAKLVNDLLPERRVPFWRLDKTGDYFDGCIRDEVQCRRAYRYTLTQSTRHHVARDWRDYPHTRQAIDLDRGITRALELRAFLVDVPYRRYGERSRK